MALFPIGVVYFLMVSRVIWADIPISEVNIGLLNDQTFQWHAKQLIDEAKESFQGMKLVSSGAQAGLSLIPYIGKVSASGISYLVDSETSKRWQDALLRGISDATQASIANTFIGNVRSSLNTISRTFTDFRRISDLTNSSKTSMSHDIHSNIITILHLFSDNQSIFRSHPNVAIMPLTTLTSLVAVFYPLFNEYVPQFKNELFVACELKNILIEYRRHLVYYRLRHLKYESNNFMRPVAKGHLISGSIIPNMEIFGNFSSSIPCSKSRLEWNVLILQANENIERLKMKDLVTDQKYYFFEDSSCLLDYTKLIQCTVNNAFRVLINAMTNFCPQEVENRRTKTGMGWLTVAVNHAVAQKLNNGNDCDLMSACDPQVKIFINDREYSKTKSVEATYQKADFFEMFVSEKINRNSKISLQMYDDDGGDSYEYMLYCPTTIPAVSSGEVICTNDKNSLSFSLYWIDEYEDNRT